MGGREALIEPDSTPPSYRCEMTTERADAAAICHDTFGAATPHESRCSGRADGMTPLAHRTPPLFAMLQAHPRACPMPVCAGSARGRGALRFCNRGVS